MDQEIVSKMREDWNGRASEDAHYYVAFGRRDQDEEEFYATGKEMVAGLKVEMKRLGHCANPRARRALEIGCGPGRLLKPMSELFGEIHGVDISNQMIDLARQRLAAIPHAHVHVATNSDLAAFADESFDLVYSYAVFQHIPSREVVMNYLREARRVLKTGGLLRCQMNGLPEHMARYDTWSGVRIPSSEMEAFCRESDMQLVALEGRNTQYMWVSAIKHPKGWYETNACPEIQPAIRRVTNAASSEPVAPSHGRFASLSLWIENLPQIADLLDFEVTVGGARATTTYIGTPERDGLVQVNVQLPMDVSTGLQPVMLGWRGEPWGRPGVIRIIPPPPLVGRMISLSDGIDLMSGTRIVTRSVKLTIEEVLHPEEFGAEISGHFINDFDRFCTDPVPPRFEVNFRIPEEVSDGEHNLQLWAGTRDLGTVKVVICAPTYDPLSTPSLP